MAMYNAPEQLPLEAYMIPVTGSNPLMLATAPIEGVKYMDKNVASELLYDHNLYYPSNYYAYYCTGPTGFESSGEWNNHHYFLRVDDQGPLFSGLQNESSPYIYYTPSYGYEQSPYNPYNPYIPGSVVGLEGSYVGTQQYGSYVGTQQYLTDNPYQQPISSAAHFPAVYPSASNAITSSASNALLLGTGAPAVNKLNSPCISYMPTMVSANSSVASQRFPLESSRPGPSQTSANQINGSVKWQEGSLVNATPAKQFSSQGAMPAGSTCRVNVGRSSSYSNQISVCKRDPFVSDSSKITLPGATGLGSQAYGWSTFDKFKPRNNQYNRSSHNTTRNPDFVGEQNRGPRAHNPKVHLLSAFIVRAYTTKAGDADSQGNIIIHGDQYNRDDFSDDYPDAKFFVIKSYSEDDVHKSIKYNVWSSTPNGNKKLASAYEDTQRISLVKQRSCPIFLFFSVNASGHFCGIAEMTGPVDFSKDMDFWQHDKWTGSFPVRWHVVKDVPNASFRQVVLENNENKPVTNSRDTQEITHTPGMKMLNIFKNSPLRTSIIDDFMYYEERQRIMYEERCKYFGQKFEHSQKVLAQSAHNQELHTEGITANNSLDKPLSARNECNADFYQPPVADGVPLVDAEQIQDDDKYDNIATNLDKDFSHEVNDVVETHTESFCHRPEARIEPSLSVDGKRSNHAMPSNDAENLVNAAKTPVREDGMQGSDIAKGTSDTEKEQQKCLAVQRQKIEVVSNERKSDRKICSNNISNLDDDGTGSVEAKKKAATGVHQGTLSDVVTVGSMKIIVGKPNPQEL